MKKQVLTAAEFAALEPYQRGYIVYMFGARDDQPNVPDEKNPYEADSAEAKAWDRGAVVACRDVQDMEE